MQPCYSKDNTAGLRMQFTTVNLTESWEIKARLKEVTSYVVTPIDVFVSSCSQKTLQPVQEGGVGT